jgi:cytochrome c-type biogenesis protein CcmE
MEENIIVQPGRGGRAKFIIGGLLIVAAIVFLILSSTRANAQYFFTVEELNAKGAEIIDQNVRVSGAVVGDTIQYDAENLELRFTVAHVPGDNKVVEAQGGLATVLHAAVTDPSRERMQVIYNGVMPDLLRDEAQAIMTGHMEADGLFHVDELLLKCPTKYEEAVPAQAEGG